MLCREKKKEVRTTSSIMIPSSESNNVVIFIEFLHSIVIFLLIT